MTPLFSVVMPTRNRPDLFRVALESVLEQVFDRFEIVVIDDGSSEDHQHAYSALLGSAPGFVRVLRLAATERGHGQSYALNTGASLARAEFLCFLDDDDQWTDPRHLRRMAEMIETGARRPDLVLANQKAFQNGKPLDRIVWIEDLQARLGRDPDHAGAYDVTPAELLSSPAHCHLNTMAISAALYKSIGGMDEGIRYECDRDVYLRAIDRAETIKFLPNIVARHNVPDPAAKASMSTTESGLSKRLYQLRVFDKAALLSQHPEIRRYAMRQKSYVLRHIAEDAAASRRFDRAVHYARQALASTPSLGALAVALTYQTRHWILGSGQQA